MPTQQISSVDGQERSGGSARPGSAVGTWLGALALAVAGILVFPGAIDDLSDFDATSLPRSRESSRLVSPPPASQKTIQVAPPGVLRTSFPAEAARDIDHSKTADRADGTAVRRFGRRMLHEVYEGLRQGWERLGRASIVVRDPATSGDQRIPASFMPSRS
ncbi:MAG: hypothetical protein VX672_02830 [Planctomycetota bacterium]|nr:hypothetical protein [Planctomycetota bacterium]